VTIRKILNCEEVSVVLVKRLGYSDLRLLVLSLNSLNNVMFLRLHFVVGARHTSSPRWPRVALEKKRAKTVGASCRLIGAWIIAGARQGHRAGKSGEIRESAAPCGSNEKCKGFRGRGWYAWWCSLEKMIRPKKSRRGTKVCAIRCFRYNIVSGRGLKRKLGRNRAAIAR